MMAQVQAPEPAVAMLSWASAAEWMVLDELQASGRCVHGMNVSAWVRYRTAATPGVGVRTG